MKDEEGGRRIDCTNACAVHAILSKLTQLKYQMKLYLFKCKTQLKILDANVQPSVSIISKVKLQMTGLIL